MILPKPDREKALSNSEKRYRKLVETMGHGLTEVDENQVATYANEMLCRMWGRTQNEIIGWKVDQFLDDENKKILFAQHEKRQKGESHPYEIVWTRKDGSKLHAIMTPTPYFDDNGKFKGSFAIVTDISKHKKEKNLLELRIKQRTRELENKTRNLEEVNTALRVLLKKREEDKTVLEERMVLNVRELIIPYIERIREDNLSDSQQGCLDIMESTLYDIVSPFLHKLSLEFLNLTPSEIQVANMVKYGKTTKEIAQILNLSGKTVEFYRKRIRKKVGITNKSINLQTFLSSTE
ncbi:PAS domain S-box protein [Desulfobacula phenolica]|uniref:PAS domain S-box-containing protein n=1 Tax=Desulfobacula phenolica TaxID=90732 RepID=A0A1H2GIH6_9BACT|nr:PAS domain S-box protein [Desulfobacula phenolica]SDU19417.1 PAS domain S-box-containing protein [Desulfobacula phenolica]